MYFLEYNLGLFNKLNTFYRAEFPQFPELKPKIEELIQSVALNFMNQNYVKKTSAMDINPDLKTEHVDLNKIYLGVQATTLLVETENKRTKGRSRQSTFRSRSSNFILMLFDK